MMLAGVVSKSVIQKYLFESRARKKVF